MPAARRRMIAAATEGEDIEDAEETEVEVIPLVESIVIVSHLLLFSEIII